MSSNRVKKDVRAYQKANPGTSYAAARRVITENTPASVFDVSDYAARWEKNEYTNDLTIPLGWKAVGTALDPSTEVVRINPVDVAHGGTGPHGVLQGVPGTGKSYLIHNMVTSLCSTYSPSKVNIRVEGFKNYVYEFPPFPHIVSNQCELEDSRERVDQLNDEFLAEIKRREEILFKHRCKDIYEYRALSSETPSMEPFPFLIVFVKDFHEFMNKNRPCLQLFRGIGAKGRSLGIHLILSNQFIDAGLLGDFMNHLTFGISFTASSTSHSRAVLGDASAASLPRGKGHAAIRYVDKTTQDNHIDTFVGFSHEMLDMELGNIPLESLVETTTPFSKLPQNSPDLLSIGGTADNPLTVSANESITFGGDFSTGSAFAVLSMIAASAEHHIKGHRSRWIVFDRHGELAAASEFPNVSDTFTAEDVEDSPKMGALYESVKVASNVENPSTIYIVSNGSYCGDVVNLFESFPNVHLVDLDNSVSDKLWKRYRRQINVQSLSDGAASSSGFVYSWKDGLWTRVSPPVKSGAEILFSNPEVSAYAKEHFKEANHIRSLIPNTCTSRNALLRTGNELLIGAKPFTSNPVTVSKDIAHVSIVGGKCPDTQKALRTYIQSLTENYTSQQARFVVSDFDIDLADTVKSLIDAGYMSVEDYAVNADEWKELYTRETSLIKERIPTRERVLQGKSLDGKWYEGKEVFLILNNPDVLTQEKMSNWNDTFNTYDVGAHCVRVTDSARYDLPENSAHIVMWGGDYVGRTSVGFQASENKIKDRATVCVRENGRWEEIATHIAEPTF